MDEVITYMGYEWVQVEDGSLTIGINDIGLEEFTELLSLALPEEGAAVTADEICGELETDQGPMNIYSPVDGKISEINEAIIENPSLILEDCTGDGWLFKVEPNDMDDVKELSTGKSSDADEDKDKSKDKEDDDNDAEGAE